MKTKATKMAAGEIFKSHSLCVFCITICESFVFLRKFFAAVACRCSADLQSAVSPNCIRQSAGFADPFDWAAARGLQIRDTAEYNSALLRLRLRRAVFFCGDSISEFGFSVAKAMSPLKPPDFGKPDRLKNKLFRQVAALLGLAFFLLASSFGFGGEVPATEYQVKAVFLFNFAKYVDWPAAAFTNASAPITIGVLGEDRFDDNLRRTVAGKTVNGRAFVIRHIAVDESTEGCHILFISDSEKKRLGEILDKIKARPVLTVGETGQFLESGGMINFVKKEGRIRLEINLDAARQAGLQISSKLLNVADAVKGKLN